MNVTRHITTEYELTLTEEERVWLRSIMQNPLHNKESLNDVTMRELFWENLTTSEELNYVPSTQN